MSCPAKWFLVSDLASAYATHAHRTQRRVFRWLTHFTLQGFARELRPGTAGDTVIQKWLLISAKPTSNISPLTMLISSASNTHTVDPGDITGTACVPCRRFRCVNLASRRCISLSAYSTPSLNGMLEVLLYKQLVHVSWLCLAEPGKANAGIALKENP